MYVGPTQLQAAITPELRALSGTFPLTVTDPGVATSTARSFTVSPVLFRSDVCGSHPTSGGNYSRTPRALGDIPADRYGPRCGHFHRSVVHRVAGAFPIGCMWVPPNFRRQLLPNSARSRGHSR